MRSAARSRPRAQHVQEPDQPARLHGAIYMTDTASLNNAGSGATWTPMTAIVSRAILDDPVLLGLTAVTDPLTGGTRLIAGAATGVFTGLLGSNGQFIQNIGDVTNINVASASADVPIVNLSRNGNLQIAQLYSGAVQPNSLATQVAGALFYAQSTTKQSASGAPDSAPDLLPAAISPGTPPPPAPWPARAKSCGTTGGSVATDPSGTGTVYQYHNPCCGGTLPNFFLVNGVGQTNGLLSAGGPNPDPQWPNVGPSPAPPAPRSAPSPSIRSTTSRSSSARRPVNVYATSNQGRQWVPVATPAGGSPAATQAVAFGAPTPSDPTGATGTFYYAGTAVGKST